MAQKRWDEHDAKLVFDTIKGLWKEPSQEMWDVQSALLSKYYSKTVVGALKKMRAEAENGFMPQPMDMDTAVKSYIRDKKKELGSIVEAAACPFCEGQKAIPATVYIGKYDLENEIPGLFRCATELPGRRWLIQPSLGKDLAKHTDKVRKMGVAIPCGHCEGLSTGKIPRCSKWQEKYGESYLEMTESQTRIYRQCCLDTPPYPERVYTLRELKEVDPDIYAMAKQVFDRPLRVGSVDPGPPEG